MIIYDLLDSLVQVIADAMMKPADQLKLVVCLLLNVFLGIFLNVFVPPITFVRHVYCIGLGLMLLGYLYTDTLYHVFTMSYPVYLMMWLLPRKKQQFYVTGWLVFYMSGQHIYRMYTNYGGYDMDITSYTMILFCKLWGMSWAYMDGAKAGKGRIVKGKIDTALTDYQEANAIHQLPSFLEFNSFVLFYGGCVVGPTFEFAYYRDWIALTGQYAKMPRGFPDGLACVAPAMTRLATGVLFIILNVALLMLGYDAESCGTEEFAQNAFLPNVWFYVVAMQARKFMFYIPWCLTDSALIGCGLAFKANTKDESGPTWDRVVSVYVWAVESDPSPPQKMVYWNHGVHLWLKNHVALRLVKKGERLTTAANMLTFGVSAFWHGFYPFYYIMFFMAALFVETCKDIYRARILFAGIPPKVNFVLAHFFVTLGMQYFGTTMCCLTFEKGWNFMRGTWSFVYILVPVVFAAVKMSGLVSYAKKVEAKQKELKNAETKKDK